MMWTGVYPHMTRTEQAPILAARYARFWRVLLVTLVQVGVPVGGRRG